MILEADLTVQYVNSGGRSGNRRAVSVLTGAGMRCGAGKLLLQTPAGRGG
jgi:hypothetical protein